MVTLDLVSGISLEVNPTAHKYIYILYFVCVQNVAELKNSNKLYGECTDTCGSQICWDP